MEQYFSESQMKMLIQALNDNLLYSQHRQETPDGSHYLEFDHKELKKTAKKQYEKLGEEKKKYKEEKKTIQSNISETKEKLKKATDADEIEKLTKDLDDLNKELKNTREKLKDVTAEQKKWNPKDVVEKRNKHLSEEAAFEVSNRVTSGKRWEYERKGQNMENFGNALARFGIDHGMKGTLGVAGKQIEKLGKSFNFGGKFGGPAAAIGAAAQVVGAVADFATQQQQFKTQQQAIENQRQLGLTQAEGQMAQAEATKDITIAKNNLQTQLEFEQGKNAIATDAKAAATEIGLQSMTDIAGGAFAAASKQIQIDAAIEKLAVKTDAQVKITKAQNELAKKQYSVTKANTEAQIRSTNVQADTAMELSKYEQTQSYVQGAKNMVEGVPVVSEVLGAADSIMSYGKSKLEYQNQQLNFNAQMQQTKTQIKGGLQQQLAEATTSMDIMQIQNALAQEEQRIDAVAREEQAKLKFGEAMFNAWQKSETAAYAMGRAFNYNEDQLLDYAKTLSHTAVTVSKWGKTMEDMEKLQSSFQETTGRNRHLSEKDFDKSFANGMLVGDDVVSQLNSGMEIFHMSVADSNDMFYDMYKQVTKMGLSGKKFGKDLVQNLKLAEKYDFKGGVESLMKMSKWAQNMRFNVNSLDGMLNKVQEGGLNGIIQQSAELQVLGGNFAMGADPLAMAYESFADPEAYAKRIAGMVGGMGHLNNKGQAEFGISENIIMRQAAKSLGMDYNDLRKMANQQLVTGQIKDLVTQDFDEDQLAAIANNATYKDGKWVVNDANGQVKEVSQLTAADVEGLSGKDNEGTVEENVQNMLSTAQQMAGVQTKIKASIGENLWQDLHTSAEEMANNVNSAFETNMKTYTGYVTKAVNLAKETQDSILQMGNNDDQWGGIGKKLNDIGGKLSCLTNIDANVRSVSDYLTGVSTSSGGLDTFSKNMTNETWLRRSLIEGNQEFKTMEYLYKNLDTIMEEMKENPEYYNPNTKKYTTKAMEILYGIQAWDPTGDITSMPISEEHYNILNDAVKWYSEYYNMHTKPYTTASNFMKKYKNDPEKAASFDWRSSNGLTQDGEATWIKNVREEWRKQQQRTAALREVFGDSTSVANEGYSKYGTANDGIVYQNGSLTRIDSNDQVLAAKENGPIDKMLDMVRPQPMSYDTYVKENPYGRSIDNENTSKQNDKIEIAPISININGNIKVNGDNIDITAQISNDPLFKDALWKLISVEVAKRVDNSGRLNDPLYNRIQNV